MRILLTHVYAWPEVRRGGERYLHELGAALVADGHDVTIVSTAPRPRRDTVLGVDVVYLPRRHRLRRYRELAPEACFGLEVLLRRALSRVDVWHALGTADGAAAATLARLRPGVRSVYTDLGNPQRAWRESRPDAALHRRIVRHVDEYVCLSEFSHRMLVEDFGRRGRVVGGGVDINRFVPSAPRSEVPTLLFSGNPDDPRKNLSLLIEAVSILRERGAPVRLIVSGQATRPLGLPEWVDFSGAGSLDQLPALYSAAWATVLPSVHEAFGLALVESLACGTPVVALRDGGGSAELVTPAVGALAATSAADLARACGAAIELAGRAGAVVDACREAARPHDWRTGVLPRLLAAYR